MERLTTSSSTDRVGTEEFQVPGICRSFLSQALSFPPAHTIPSFDHTTANRDPRFATTSASYYLLILTDLVVLISICVLPYLHPCVYAMSNLVQSQTHPPPSPFHSERIIPGIPDPVVVTTRFRRFRATVSSATIDAYHRRLPPSIVFSCSFPLSLQLSVYHRTRSFPPTLVHRYHSSEVTWRPVDCQPHGVRSAPP